MCKSTKKGQTFSYFFLVSYCIIFVTLSSCGIGQQEQEKEVHSRTIRAGDVTTVKDKPFRWNTGTTWNHRWLWDELEQLEENSGEKDYLEAEKTGIVHKLHFGTKIKIINVKVGFRYQFNRYQVEVLDGELIGKLGWTEFNSIKDFYITE